MHSKRVGFFVLLFVFVLAVSAQPARAQGEEPTPSPTPNYQLAVSISENQTLIIERRITYGEIAVTLAILGLGILFVLYFLFRFARSWLH